MPNSTDPNWLTGVPFAKMTGSGNDFVFFDARQVDRLRITRPEVIQAICNRYNGIGADGIVVLEPVAHVNSHAPVATDVNAIIHYFNSDGSPADLCGNATLCSTAMAVEMGIANIREMGLATPAGHIASRIANGLPEIDLQAVADVRPDVPIALGTGERRVGFAMAGIPHVVVLCDDADAIDVVGRGPGLRRHEALGPAGANVNWVSARADGTWRYRTFERGVEGETLACGTGAVATAVLLTTWGLSAADATIRTSSGRDLIVRLTALPGGGYAPSLRGEGRVVFRGTIGTLPIHTI